jgi:hypothetical protein
MVYSCSTSIAIGHFSFGRLFLAVTSGTNSLPKGDAATLLVASAVAVIFLCLGLPAIPALFREVKFYHGCGWDLRRDSGASIYKQREFVSRFSFLPVGLVKLLYHTNRIFMMLIVVTPLGIGAIRSFS